MADAWYPVLQEIARYQPVAYWRMSYGAVFFWCPRPPDVLPDGFATQPFSYSQIESVTVYRYAQAGRDVFDCEWAALVAALQQAPGVNVVVLTNAKPWPTSPPTDALRLTVSAAA